MRRMGAESGTQAIDRAAQLLVRVVESPQPPSIGELSAGAGLPKSTTSRLVGALERQGLVQRARRPRTTPARTGAPPLSRAATPRRHSSSSRSRACGASPTRAARRSTSRFPARTASSTSPSRTPRTSSASPTGSGGASRSSSRRTASASWRSAAARSTKPPRIRSRGYADVDRRARGRPGRARRSGPRPEGRRRRGSLHLRPHDPPHRRAHRGARAAPASRRPPASTRRLRGAA